MSCITLLSDFGLMDASVATTKGILMQHTPLLPIVDVSHLVEPYHLQQAAYILASSYRHFEKGTVHLILFDIFSEKQPRLLLCEREGYFFLAPDNGILPLTFAEPIQEMWSCFELTSNYSFKDWIERCAEIIHKLQSKTAKDLGLERCEIKNAPQHWQPKVNGSEVECHVIHIDRFENVVVNITKKQFETIGQGRPFSINFMRSESITEISAHYSNVKESDKLCRFNSAGFLEIAINHGNAASLFGLRLSREHHIVYNTIKIVFE